MPHSMVWSEVERVQLHARYVANQCCLWDAPMQICGQRYCPGAPGQIPKEEWLLQKKAEACWWMESHPCALFVACFSAQVCL